MTVTRRSARKLKTINYFEDLDDKIHSNNPFQPASSEEKTFSESSETESESSDSHLSTNETISSESKAESDVGLDASNVSQNEKDEKKRMKRGNQETKVKKVGKKKKTEKDYEAMMPDRKRVFTHEYLSMQSGTELNLQQFRKLELWENWEFQLEHLHPMMADFRRRKPLENSNCISQPENLLLTLLPFQFEGVGWLLNQERSTSKGGILADEMGMGKTIQMISLMLESRRKTLIVAPAVAMYQWKKEIETHVSDGIFNVGVYHGTKKNNFSIQKYDIVITSYGTLATAYSRMKYGLKRKGKKVTEDSVLHYTEFGRIILDEAHSIKDRTCVISKAVFSLEAEFRWGLTGTPVQNRVGDYYSLVRFLRIKPYSFYMCKDCECEMIDWKFNNTVRICSCGHHAMKHFCWWNREIINPIQKYGFTQAGKYYFDVLKKCLDEIMLRRTKVERSTDLRLPVKRIEIINCKFNEEELDFYKALFSESKVEFNIYLRDGSLMNNYAHIFDLLTKMRLAANHPFLVMHNQRIYKEQTQTVVCNICFEPAQEPVMSKCRHLFCREDISKHLFTSSKCPVCFVQISIDLTQDYVPAVEKSIVTRIDLDHWRSSTKIEMLCHELYKLQSENHTEKCIVFSQYVNFLDIISWRLNRAGFRNVKLDGSMTPTQRQSIIEAFTNEPGITVFLISLRAGGVALNLTAASRVFMMDLWWNPAVEDQAMDRIHRLGQTRPIKIQRIVVENSIESRILELQEKKRALFQSTVGGDINALSKLVPEDLEFLFA